MQSEIVLAFDIGLKRTGVATGQDITKSAQPAGLITGRNGQLDWDEIDKLIDRWQPTLIVVGDPQTQNPHLNKVINRFKQHIQVNHKIAIQSISERLSSNAANHELSQRDLNEKQKIELRDQIAACLILESYFAEQ